MACWFALTDDRGRLLWISAARPGRTAEITACRHDKLTQELREAGLGAIAYLQPLTRSQQLSNKVLATGREPVEHSFAHLKNWRVLGKVCTDPKRRSPWSGPCWSSPTTK